MCPLSLSCRESRWRLRSRTSEGQTLVRPSWREPFPTLTPSCHEQPKNSCGESRGRAVGTGRNAGLRFSAVWARLERDLLITLQLALFIRHSWPVVLFPAARGPERLASKFCLAGWKGLSHGALTPQPSAARTPLLPALPPRSNTKGLFFPAEPVAFPLPSLLQFLHSFLLFFICFPAMLWLRGPRTQLCERSPRGRIWAVSPPALRRRDTWGCRSFPSGLPSPPLHRQKPRSESACSTRSPAFVTKQGDRSHPGCTDLLSVLRDTCSPARVLMCETINLSLLLCLCRSLSTAAAPWSCRARL